MIGDVFAARTVAPFASDAEDEAVAFVLVGGSGPVLEPGIVAFQAASRGLAGEIAGAVGVERASAPMVERMKPGCRQLIEAVVVPGEVDLVGPAGAVGEGDACRGSLVAGGRGLNGGLKKVAAGVRHLEGQGAAGRSE